MPESQNKHVGRKPIFNIFISSVFRLWLIVTLQLMMSSSSLLMYHCQVSVIIIIIFLIRWQRNVLVEAIFKPRNIDFRLWLGGLLLSLYHIPSSIIRIQEEYNHTLMMLNSAVFGYQYFPTVFKFFSSSKIQHKIASYQTLEFFFMTLNNESITESLPW